MCLLIILHELDFLKINLKISQIAYVITQAQSTVLLGISSTQPYDPRVKRHKLKPYDRKPRVELNNSSHQELQGPDLAMVSTLTFDITVVYGLSELIGTRMVLV